MPNLIEEQKLILAEVGANSNKYYFIKLFDDDSVVANYGRVGVTEQTTDYRGGKLFFDKKVREKCKKGYSLLKVVGGSSSISSSVSNSSLKEIALQQIKTNKPELTKLISRLVDANIHRIVSNTSISYNDTTGLFSTPLGIITPDAVVDARNLLVEIKKSIVKGDYSSGSLIKNVNQYCRTVPQNLGMKLDIRVLFPDDAAIQSQLSILDSLESSYQTLQSAPPTNKTVDQPKVFDTELDILDDSREIDRISRWFHTSNHTTHGYSNVKIRNFYKVKIRENWENFNEKLGNTKEVWHGTSESNLTSILKSGLKLSPPSTTYIVGALFGRGHYGAVDSSKSLQYTFGRFGGNKGDSGWCWVCDFSLGNTYYITKYGGSLPSGYDSIYAKREKTGLRFDELIVPTNNQVRLKYLLEVK